MMLKNIWIISIVYTVLVQSFTTAQDVCIPCNKQTFNNFLNCINLKMSQNNFLSRTSEADIADTKDSIIFAVDAMHTNKKRFKERVMTGVLATEMCELLSNDGSISRPDVIAQALSGFVRQCYTDETGETNEIFFNEFQSLVNSLLKLEGKELESDDASQSSATAHSKTFDEDFQGADRSQEPINYAYSNAEITNFESNDLNRKQNLLLQSPTLQTQQNGEQTHITSATATAENQNQYIPVNWQQIRSPSESRGYSLAESEANYERNVQPTYKKLEIGATNTNHDYTAINTFSEPQFLENQNSYNDATVVNSVYRNNAVFKQDIPPQNQMESVQPPMFSQVGENEWDRRRIDNLHSSTIQPEYSPVSMQSTSSTGDVSSLTATNMNKPQELKEGNRILNMPEQINSYPSEQHPEYNNQYQRISLDQNTNNSDSKKSTAISSSNTSHGYSTTSSKKYKKRRHNSQKKQKKSKKQKNVKPVVLNQVIDDSRYEIPIDYSTSLASIEENSPYEVQSTSNFENVGSLALTPGSSNADSTYYLSTTKTPSKKRLTAQKTPIKSKEKEYVTTTASPKVPKSEFSFNNSPSTQDFQRSSNGGYAKIKALEFGETIFVLLSKNELFCKAFNKDTANANAQYQTFQIVSKGMIQCGYTSISEEAAYSCRDAISSVKEGSTSQVYSQTIAKAIMIYFYRNNFIEDNSKNQGKSVALAMIQFLPKPFYPQNFENLSDQSVQNQENPRSYSYSELNPSSQTNTENTSSGDSVTNAEDEMYKSDYNMDGTRKEAEILGEKSKSYSGDSNYEYDNGMNDEDVTESNETGKIEKDSNFGSNQEYEDRNDENGDIKKLAIATDNDQVDYECDTVTDESRDDNYRTNTLRPNNYKESNTYANSHTIDSFNEEKNDSNNDSKAESLTASKPLQKKTLNSKRNKGKKKKSTKDSSLQSQNRSQSSSQEKVKEEKHEGKPQSKERIKLLKSAAIKSVSGGKFNYELFIKTLSRLIAKTNNTESAWSDEGQVFAVLMETIVALTQLLAQN